MILPTNQPWSGEMSKLSHSHQPTMDQIDAEKIRDDGFSMDKEANDFAMALLMPEEWLRKDLQALRGVDIESDVDGKIQRLAKKYKVSTNIMILRIGQLLRTMPDGAVK